VKIFAISGIINALSLVIFNIIFLLFLDVGATGYLLAILLANIVSAIYIYITAKLHNYISYRMCDNALLKVMIIYSLPLIPNALSWWMVNMSNRFIVLFYYGAATAGVFIAASKLPSIINMIAQIFMQAWKISSSKEINKENNEAFFTNIFKIFSSMVWVFTSGILLALPLLIGLFLRNDFQDGGIYVPLLLFAAAINSFSAFFGSFYVAAKKTKGAFISTSIGAVINITLAIIMVPLMGVYGVLVSGVIGYLALVVFRVVDTKKYVSLNVNWVVTTLCFLLLLLQSIISTLRLQWYKQISVGIFIIILIIVILSLKELLLELKKYLKSKYLKA
jgi:O-antigen/teichoic acid export membrane protein